MEMTASPSNDAFKRPQAKRCLANAPASGSKAMAACPTGSLLVKRVGYAVPVGQRKYDHLPIGSEIEERRAK